MVELLYKGQIIAEGGHIVGAPSVGRLEVRDR